VRKRTPEGDVQAKIVTVMRTMLGNRGTVERQSVGRRGHVQFGKPGWLDLRVIADGGHYGEWEIKTPEKRDNLSDDQRARIAELQRLGTPTGVLWSEQMAVDAMLRAFFVWGWR